jgi:hypothetical protein
MEASRQLHTPVSTPVLWARDWANFRDGTNITAKTIPVSIENQNYFSKSQPDACTEGETLAPLFYTMTNKCTIISQIITLLHVSTLSCHPQRACNQYLAK